MYLYFVLDCKELKAAGQTTDGVYAISINGYNVDVQCDMTGGGWTLIQRRIDDSVSFERSWQCYKVGFGNVSTNYWLGMENIRALTSEPSKLRVKLVDYSDNMGTATYSTFSIAEEQQDYQLTLTGYSGNLGGDSFGSYSNGYKFSTADHDNDIHSFNCAERYSGAWWYRGCCQANLNGQYRSNGYVGDRGIHWIHWYGDRRALKRAEIKVKRY